MMFTLVFYNIVECMVPLSLFKSMYVEVLYPILLHIFEAHQQKQVSPSKKYFKVCYIQISISIDLVLLSITEI